MLNLTLLRERIDAFTLTQPRETYTINIPEEKGPRKYLGLSALGDECKRKVWLQWRQCLLPQFPARLLRLFRRGHREEAALIFLLRGAGLEIFEHDSEGKQFKVTELEGHLSGHCDGVGKAPKELWENGSKDHPFLLEFKTYGDRRYNELCKRSVRVSDPKYFTQVQCYMGLMKLKSCLFCAVNKNDDSLYFEWVAFDKRFFIRTMEGAQDLVNAKSPPPKISMSATDYRCKMCELHGICHKGQPSLVSCRSCKFAEPISNGKWGCLKGREFGEPCGEWKDIAKEK